MPPAVYAARHAAQRRGQICISRWQAAAAARPPTMSKKERLSKLDELLNRASMYSEFLGEQTAQDGDYVAGTTTS